MPASMRCSSSRPGSATSRRRASSRTLDDYAAKWKLPLDDFYDTYLLNYGHFGDKGLYGIPFDCDIQMVHICASRCSSR